MSWAFIQLPSGPELPVEGEPLWVSTASVELVVELNEPGELLFTRDGTAPVQGQPNTGRSTAPLRLTLDEDTTVRWIARDLVGNTEEGARAEVHFDRTAPALVVSPPPGRFDEAVWITLQADEPATLYWTEDGSSPVPNAPTTQRADTLTRIQLSRTTTLRALARDRVGNQTVVGPLRYLVDDQPPQVRLIPPAGAYLGPVWVEIHADDPAATLTVEQNGESSPYRGAFELSEDTTLTVTAVDPYGLQSSIEASYRFGPREERPFQFGDQPETFEVAGGLGLAAALLEGAGLASGQQRQSTPEDATLAGVGLTVADAFLFQSGQGPALLDAPAFQSYAAGQRLDPTEALNTRLEVLAEAAGRGSVPQGIALASILITQTNSGLARPEPLRQLDDGRPLWAMDYAGLRWETPPERALTGAASLGSGLWALAIRAQSALSAPHPSGPGLFAEQVVPVVGPRCGLCHRAQGASPPLLTEQDYRRLSDPSLLDLLDGRGTHPVKLAPVTALQRAQVAQWIAAQTPSVALAEAPGVSTEQGYLGLVALEQAGFAMADLSDRLFLSTAQGAATSYAAQGLTYPLTEAALSVGPEGALAITPTVQAFELKAQARLLKGLVSIARLYALEPSLVGSISPTPIERARQLVGLQAGLVVRLLADPETGALVSHYTTGSGRAPTIDTVAAAEALLALRQAIDVLPELDEIIGRIPAQTLVVLSTQLRTPQGDFYAQGELVGQGLVDIDEREPRPLAAQMAMLEAYAWEASRQTPGAAEAALALWARLELTWWDDRAGAWQTSLGVDEDRYSVELAQRVLSALNVAIEAGIPRAKERRARFLHTVILKLMRSEIYWTGEIDASMDADADGIPRPAGVSQGDGAAPVFAAELIR